MDNIKLDIKSKMKKLSDKISEDLDNDKLEELRNIQKKQIEELDIIKQKLQTNSSEEDIEKPTYKFSSLKLILIILILYIIISHPLFNKLLGKYVNVLLPNEDNSVSLQQLIVRGFILGIFVYIINT